MTMTLSAHPGAHEDRARRRFRVGLAATTSALLAGSTATGLLLHTPDTARETATLAWTTTPAAAVPQALGPGPGAATGPDPVVDLGPVSPAPDAPDRDRSDRDRPDRDRSGPDRSGSDRAGAPGSSGTAERGSVPGAAAGVGGADATAPAPDLAPPAADPARERARAATEERLRAEMTGWAERVAERWAGGTTGPEGSAAPGGAAGSGGPGGVGPSAVG